MLIALFFSCTKYEKVLRIKDLLNPQRHDVTINCDPTGIILDIQGELNGSATLEVLSETDPNERYMFRLEEGLVDTSMRGDWYSKEIYLQYAPQGASEGYLTIKVNICGLF